MAKKHIQKDVVIIGAGMAGLTAALYCGRMNLRTLVLENSLVGGQIATAADIENYPGFERVSGMELIGTLEKQATNFGAEIDEFDRIERVDLKSTPKIVETETYIYETPVIIIASGMNRRKLPLPQEPHYFNRGVHYCHMCDGHTYQGKVISVMGGGNAAVDAANFLTKYASHLYLIHRSQLRADKTSQDALYANPKVTVMLETEIEHLNGEDRLTSVDLLHKDTGKRETLPVDSIFVNIGVLPNTDLFVGQLKLTETGYIAADENCRTEIPGVFVAGDIRVKEIHQLTTAAADGTTAALHAEKYLAGLKK